ncbi:flavodoxin family protein [Loigolactobacillus binensis]|uniref:Flavodoxin family protein n=1 Tax=Loigolactobacillus binensis TaxID=2559922 RepID=A0ABW3EBV1_9LACO|nr:flavodoxin family protein [Loigolactobacillus binensis]
MNVKVLYHSSTGNTRKLADAIANVIGVSAEPITKESISFSVPIDLLFIGDGIYFGKPNKNTIAFINQLTPQTVKNVAVFATYGGQGKIGADIKKMFNAKSINIIGEPFVCKGQSWILMNRKHPDKVDIKKASDFAKSMIRQID